MSPYLAQLLAEAHAADLTQQAERTRLARAARTAGRRPGRLRASTARLLVAAATRLDDRRQLPAPHVPGSGAIS